MTHDATGKEREQTPRDHRGRFKPSVTPRNGIDSAISLLARDNRPETLVSLFDGRASYHTIRDWRRGKNSAPQWAIDLLHAKISAPLARLAQQKAGPGRGAGYRNLGSWRAARNQER